MRVFFLSEVKGASGAIILRCWLVGYSFPEQRPSTTNKGVFLIFTVFSGRRFLFSVSAPYPAPHFLLSFRVSTGAFARKTFARPKKTPALQAIHFLTSGFIWHSSGNWVVRFSTTAYNQVFGHSVVNWCNTLLINCTHYITAHVRYYIVNTFFEFTKRLETYAHSCLLVWTYRERRVGLYATWAFLWFAFPARTSSISLNSNSDKTSKVTPIIKSLQTTQIAFLIRNVFWVFWGSKGEIKIYIYSCKRRCKGKSYETTCENIVPRYQTLCLPSPGSTFFCIDDRIYNWACFMGGSPVITHARNLHVKTWTLALLLFVLKINANCLQENFLERF